MTWMYNLRDNVDIPCTGFYWFNWEGYCFGENWYSRNRLASQVQKGQVRAFKIECVQNPATKVGVCEDWAFRTIYIYYFNLNFSLWFFRCPILKVNLPLLSVGLKSVIFLFWLIFCLIMYNCIMDYIVHLNSDLSFMLTYMFWFSIEIPYFIAKLSKYFL